MRTNPMFALTPLLLVGPLFLVPARGFGQQARPVAEVQVAPAAVTVSIGATHRLSAIAYDADGNVIVTGVRYRWTSNDVNVARVDSTGTVTAVAPGSAVIRAEAVGSGNPPKRGAAAVTVRRRT
jgi:uncharacterized protein YjdB